LLGPVVLRGKASVRDVHAVDHAAVTPRPRLFQIPKSEVAILIISRACEPSVVAVSRKTMTW
jgi:hypothetical protein